MSKLSDKQKIILFIFIIFLLVIVCLLCGSQFKKEDKDSIKRAELQAAVQKDEEEYGNEYQKCDYVHKAPEKIYVKNGNEDGFYLFNNNDDNFNHLYEVSEDRMAYSSTEDFNLYCFTPCSIDTIMSSKNNYIIFVYENGKDELAECHNLVFSYSPNTRLYRLVQYLCYDKNLISRNDLGIDEFVGTTEMSGYAYINNYGFYD